jgi:hypothetical protein
MAAKPGADTQPATPDDIMSVGEMKSILSTVKRGSEASFAGGLTADKLGVVLLDRKMAPKQLRALLKKQAEGIGLDIERGSLRYGTATVDAQNLKIVQLAINKDAGGALLQKLRERIRDAGFKDIDVSVG